MRYVKPELVVLTDAISAVQAGTGKHFHTIDPTGVHIPGMSPAYEGDE